MVIWGPLQSPHGGRGPSSTAPGSLRLSQKGINSSHKRTVLLRLHFAACGLWLVQKESKVKSTRMTLDGIECSAGRESGGGDSGGPVVENPPPGAGDENSVSGRGTKIPHTSEQLSPRAPAAEPGRHSVGPTCRSQHPCSRMLIK